MKTTASLILFLSLSMQAAPLAAAFEFARDPHPTGSQQSSRARPPLSEEEKILHEKIAASSETPIKFYNEPLAPLAITKASARYVPLESSVAESATEPGSRSDTYATDLGIVLKNTGSSDVNGLILEFTNAATTFQFCRVLTIAAGKEQAIRVDLIFVPGQPSSLLVKLVGAELAQSIVWGEYKTFKPLPPPPSGTAVLVPGPEGLAGLPLNRPAPSPIPPKPALPPQASAADVPLEEGATSVDTRPVMLNRPRPNYTEVARKNGVNGTTVLRILIGSDGRVKQVKVKRALPDFLTEEAIRSAFEIRFKPAMKSEQPVAYWQVIEVDFSLR